MAPGQREANTPKRMARASSKTTAHQWRALSRSGASSRRCRQFPAPRPGSTSPPLRLPNLAPDRRPLASVGSPQSPHTECRGLIFSKAGPPRPRPLARASGACRRRQRAGVPSEERRPGGAGRPSTEPPEGGRSPKRHGGVFATPVLAAGKRAARLSSRSPAVLVRPGNVTGTPASAHRAMPETASCPVCGGPLPFEVLCRACGVGSCSTACEAAHFVAVHPISATTVSMSASGNELTPDSAVVRPDPRPEAGDAGPPRQRRPRRRAPLPPRPGYGARPLPARLRGDVRPVHARRADAGRPAVRRRCHHGGLGL